MHHASHFLSTGRSIQIQEVSHQLVIRLRITFPANNSHKDSCQGAVALPIVWVTFISSVLTDLYLIMVPLPMLWGTTLKLAKKIAATFVLGAGIFVLVCSLLKTVFVITVSSLHLLPTKLHSPNLNSSTGSCQWRTTCW
jgi:hypothetical protein